MIAFQLFKVGLPIMALYEDEQSTTRKFTFLMICYGYVPTTTGKEIVPTDCTFIPPKPTGGSSLDGADLVLTSSAEELDNTKCLPSFH